MKESAEMGETGYSSFHSPSAPSLSGIRLPVWSPSYDGVVVHSFVHRMGEFLERMSRYQLLYGVATADAANLVLNEKQIRFGLDLQVPLIRDPYCLTITYRMDKTSHGLSSYRSGHPVG